jgi:AcrR family transcriptional regulator
LTVTKRLFSLLNMRSVAAQELIKKGVELFSEKGFESVSVREITNAAGVSPGLLIHHFKSKEAFIKACIEDVFGEVLSFKTEPNPLDITSQLNKWKSNPEFYKTPLKFFKAVMASKTDYSKQLFELFLEGSRKVLEDGVEKGLVNKPSSLEMTNLVLAVNSLGTILLSDYIRDQLGGEFTDPEYAQGFMQASLEIYTNGVYTPQTTGEK